MNLLFVHQNFPGQYKNLALHLAEAGHRVVAVRQHGSDLPGVESVVYRPPEDGTTSTDRYTLLVEPALRRAAAVRDALWRLRDQGFRPDAVLGHAAWGEVLFVKDVWPDVPLVAYMENFFRPGVSDGDFDPNVASAFDWPMFLRASNAVTLMTLDAMDCGVTPTRWQHSRFPEVWRNRIEVIHDGIDTERVAPHPTRHLMLPSGVALRQGDEIVTYVARGLEPHRGFPTFIAAVPEIQRRRPNAHVLVVGDEKPAYSPPAAGGESYKSICMRLLESQIDQSRLHFLGPLPYYQYLAVLQVSAAHVYLTYPSVLSWSMLEAMATGCLVVGSSTPPVMELIEDSRNGLLVDFFDVAGLAERVVAALAAPETMRLLRRAARDAVVEGYDFARVCLPRHKALIESLAG